MKGFDNKQRTEYLAVAKSKEVKKRGPMTGSLIPVFISIIIIGVLIMIALMY